MTDRPGKPTTHINDLLRENFVAETRRFLSEEYRDHRLHGCPVDRDPDSTRACLFHGPSGNEGSPFDFPSPPRRNNDRPPPRPEGDDPRAGDPIPSLYAPSRIWKHLPRWLGGTRDRDSH